MKFQLSLKKTMEEDYLSYNDLIDLFSSPHWYHFTIHFFFAFHDCLSGSLHEIIVFL